MRTKNINMPKCCGRLMNIRVDLGKFWEAQCDVCSDTIYVRKSGALKPQMLDD